MSWDLPFGIRNLNPEGSSNIDECYGYYRSTSQACKIVKPEMRRAGRTVGILRPQGIIEEYWWVSPSNLSDGGLVPKFPSTYFDFNSGYRIIRSSEFKISGDFPNQKVIADLNAESVFEWEYNDNRFVFDNPIVFDVSVDISTYERWDAICLTPDGSVELVEGQLIFIGDSAVLPVIPEGWYIYTYVYWSESPMVISPGSVRKTSDLINDGEDGVNPFISFYEFYRENTLIEGSVAHIDGYSYLVWVKEFVINKRYYNLLIEESLTLDPGHESFDRIDLFVLNDDLSISVIKGTPSDNPIKPVISGDQLEVAFVFVKAGSTEPVDMSKVVIYNENLQNSGGEADTEASTSRITLDSNDDSYKGNVSIMFDKVVLGDKVSFGLINNINKKDFDTLVFYIKLTELSKGTLLIGFLNVDSFSLNSYLEITPGRFGYNPSVINEWQLISIPSSSFNLGTIDYSQLWIVANGGESSFFIDYVHLQSGSYSMDDKCCDLDLTKYDLSMFRNESSNPFVRKNELSDGGLFYVSTENTKHIILEGAGTEGSPLKAFISKDILNLINGGSVNEVVYDSSITGLRNGSNSDFTVSEAYVPGSLEVYFDGLMLTKGNNDDFIELNPGEENNGARINRVILPDNKLIFRYRKFTDNNSENPPNS